MAIKLETKNAAPSAVSTLEIKSALDASSVVLGTEEVREAVEVGGKTEWLTSKLKVKQFLSFIGADGTPCSLEGTVLESEAVEITAAHKVVIQVQIANELKAAYQAGRVSKGYTSLELVKVVEVWDTPKNCLWRAKDAAPGVAAKVGGPVMDDSGKITRQAAA
jgi:hypothetical protein